LILGWKLKKGGNTLKAIFVSHPFGGKESNLKAISDICRRLVNFGVLPISPVHMFGFMHDNIPAERKRAMEFCEDIIQYVDELWLFGEWEKSEGCQNEHLAVLLEMIPVRVVIGWDGEEPVFAESKMPSAATEGEGEAIQANDSTDGAKLEPRRKQSEG
jgi:hypothetical protein